MTITTSGSVITFNDATTQTTAPVNTNANVTSATAVAGTGISVTAVTTTGAATHTVTNTGVTSVTAGTGISVSASTGGVTITNTAPAVNGPAFSAYQSSSQSGFSTSTWTKINFQTKEFDTNNNFDNTTNYRFTPTVAGYYQVNASYQSSGSGSDQSIALYKNGSIFKQGVLVFSYMAEPTVSALIYLNGSTDYVEAYLYISGGGRSINANAYQTYFQAAMVRGG